MIDNKRLLTTLLLCIILGFGLTRCTNPSSQKTITPQTGNSTAPRATTQKSPSDILPLMGECKILLGDGKKSNNLINYQDEDFFYTVNDGSVDWVVYKSPNSGVTSKTSSNTRTELHQKTEWVPETGGRLTGTCKVMHVSTTGDARVAASYSVVIGQIHSGEGHKNEPLKIFYKKYPDHEYGSLFWNYEINTEGEDNSGRWDYSTAIWGHDMSIIGSSPNVSPAEPTEGIKLGEEISYIVNVYKGIMYLTFTSVGHPTKTFTKNLIKSDYTQVSDIPIQTQNLFVPIGQDGTERPDAYAGELNYFKQGAYNQTNGKDPQKNMVWCTGANVYNGDITEQYANGSYTEVWFREATLGPGTPPQ